MVVEMAGIGVLGEVIGRPEELRGVKVYAGLWGSGEWMTGVEVEFGGRPVRCRGKCFPR